MVLDTVLYCPHCAGASTWRMPGNACQWRVVCPLCGRDIITLPGKCCVFCSYGSVPCPPVQQEGRGEPGQHRYCGNGKN